MRAQGHSQISFNWTVRHVMYSLVAMGVTLNEVLGGRTWPEKAGYWGGALKGVYCPGLFFCFLLSLLCGLAWCEQPSFAGPLWHDAQPNHGGQNQRARKIELNLWIFSPLMCYLATYLRVQWAKAFGTRSKPLTSVHNNYTEGEHQLLEVIIWSPHTFCSVEVPTKPNEDKTTNLKP